MLQVVFKEDFDNLIRKEFGVVLSDQFYSIIEPVIMLKSKKAQIFQYKYLIVLMREVNTQNQLDKDGTKIQQTSDGQMISFKQLDSDDEK